MTRAGNVHSLASIVSELCADTESDLKALIFELCTDKGKTYGQREEDVQGLMPAAIELLAATLSDKNKKKMTPRIETAEGGQACYVGSKGVPEPVRDMNSHHLMSALLKVTGQLERNRAMSEPEYEEWEQVKKELGNEAIRRMSVVA